MKAKFVLLIAAGLFLATASQAQFPGSYKDSRDRNANLSENTYHSRDSRGDRELRKDRRDHRNDHRKMRKHRRHQHRHAHRHAHHAF